MCESSHLRYPALNILFHDNCMWPEAAAMGAHRLWETHTAGAWQTQYRLWLRWLISSPLTHSVQAWKLFWKGLCQYDNLMCGKCTADCVWWKKTSQRKEKIFSITEAWSIHPCIHLHRVIAVCIVPSSIQWTKISMFSLTQYSKSLASRGEHSFIICCK